MDTHHPSHREGGSDSSAEEGSSRPSASGAVPPAVIPGHTPTVTRLLLGAVCFAGLCIAAHRFAGVLVPLTAAVLQTVLVLPAVDWLARHRVPRVLAASLVGAVSMILFAVLGIGAAVALADLAEGLSEGAPLGRVLGPTLEDRLSSLGLPVPSGEDTPTAVAPQFLWDAALKVLGGTGNIVLGMFTHLLLLWELPDLLDRIDRLLERSGLAGAWSSHERVTALGAHLWSYLWIKTAISALTATCAAGLMVAVGLEYVVLFTAGIFILNYVPNIGSSIAAAAPILLAASTLSLPATGALAAGLLVINVAFGNLIEPAWMGDRLRLSPSVVFIGLIGWGALWGVPGALLSVPLTHLVVQLLEARDDTRWVAELLRPGTGELGARDETAAPTSAGRAAGEGTAAEGTTPRDLREQRRRRRLARQARTSGRSATLTGL